MRDARKAIEVRDQVGHVLIGDLRLDVRRHDAPRGAHRVTELLEREVTTRQVGTESSLSFGSVTVIAFQGVTCPEFATGLKIPLGGGV